MRSKSIIAINLSNNDKRIFASVAQASKELGISRAKINNVLNGKITEANGYSFRIFPEEKNIITNNSGNNNQNDKIEHNQNDSKNDSTIEQKIDVNNQEVLEEKLTADITATVAEIENIVELTQENMQSTQLIKEEIQNNMDTLNESVQNLQIQEQPIDVENWKYKTRIIIINILYTIKQLTNTAIININNYANNLVAKLRRFLRNFF